MAQTAVRGLAVDANRDDQREVGVLVMLVAVPVIWATLVTSMLEMTPAAVGAVVGLACLAGTAVGIGHEYYVARICRQRQD